MRKKSGKLLVGTSGWSFRWPGFYPEGLASRDYLSFYSKVFKTVEINYSFYHLPRPSSYQKWADQTPDDFVFAIKASRFITHIKRLSDVKTALELFLEGATTLGQKLGPILFQLPPSFKVDVRRTEDFLASIPRPLRMAFEFRHPSWFEDVEEQRSGLDVLKTHKTAFVLAHSSRYPYPEKEPITADFVYLRFHGPEELFASPYNAEGLKSWIPKISRWLKQGLDVYAYFNNDVNGYAVKDAKILIKMASTTL